MSQRRIRIPVADAVTEPVAYNFTPKARERGNGGQCKHKSPCGHKCAMNARYMHQYHSCSRADCANCHGSQRFQRGTETA